MSLPKSLRERFGKKSLKDKVEAQEIKQEKKEVKLKEKVGLKKEKKK